MIFSAATESARWAQKTISRLNGNGDWSKVCQREACWNPTFLSALIDEVDDRLSAELGHDALEISRHLPLLAERIRAEHCPQQELGKRSLQIWALAARGSCCRYTSQLDESEGFFVEALRQAQRGALPWASADLCRRFAALLTQRGDRAAFHFLEYALNGFAGFPERTAETLILRGVARHYLDKDDTGAIGDFTAAATLTDPGISVRSRSTYRHAVINLGIALVQGGNLCFESVKRAREMLLHTRPAFGPGLGEGKLTSLWIEGLLAYRLGWNRHAVRLLQRAHRGFTKLRCFDHARAVCLDLAWTFLEDGERKRAMGYLMAAAKTGPEEPDVPAGLRELEKAPLDREALLQIRLDFARQFHRDSWRRMRASQSQA